MSVETIVTTEDLNKAFLNTNFGNVYDPRDIVRYSLLKYASIYSTGHTAKQILIELGLISGKSFTLTRKGKMYLYEAFCNGVSM